jgi:hypothetical protein
LTLLSMSCSRTMVMYPSPKVKATTVVVDGKINEWQTPLPQPSTQVAIRFRAAFDEEYLYLAVHVPDRYFQSLMLAQGASIWLDTLGKRNDNFGIGYPLALSNAQLEEIANQSKGDERLFLDNYADALQEFDLIGFVEEPVRASNITSKNMKVAAGFDDLRTLVFEIKMPLKQIFNRIPEEGTILSIGVEVNTPKTSPLDNQDDSSLFNDPTNQNNGITQSNPLMGPNTMANQQQMGPTNRKPSMPTVWARIQLGEQLEKK